MGLTTHRALKEWAVAIEALQQGRTIMMLRKGGIREQKGRFSVVCDRVWLYPTYEHQNPELLKPEYASQVQQLPSGQHPGTIAIGAWAQIDAVFQITELSTVVALLPFHIWNAQFVVQRFGWKPSQPLYVLLLRVYPLAQPYEITDCPEYRGCRSWIELAEALTDPDSVPVLDRAEYEQQVAAIRQTLGAS